MKKVCIISLGYLWFPCESGPSRFFQIAETFVKQGYQVECITTSFQHFKKAPRDTAEILSKEYPFKIHFVETPPYDKNVGWKRVYSNHVAARNLKRYLVQHVDEYDAVYISIPANNISAMVTAVCREHGVPVVVDVEDLWPEAMSMVIKSRWVRNLILWPFQRDAETTYRNADGVIGTSEDYTARAFLNQKKNIPSATVYVGCNLADFDYGVQTYSEEIEKPEGEFWVAYAGSISTSYDIQTLIDAGNRLKHQNVHIYILGTGSLKDKLEAYSKDMENIHFWGFTKYHKMAALLAKSDVVVNSFVKGAPQSIVNKVGDYLASGKAMINTLENPVFCRLVDSYQVGLNVEPGNVTVLADAIMKLKNDDQLRTGMAEKARRLAEEEFDRAVSYPRIVAMVERVMEKEHA